MRNGIYMLLGFLFTSFAIVELGVVDFQYPDHFPEPTYNFAKNELDQNKINLGRALFYDPILSLDHTISCASCHSPYNAFAHTDHDLSHGIDDKIGIRNAPPLFNLAWQSSFMWDGAVNHLDVQSLAPITSSSEMGDNLPNIISKLQGSDKYVEMFTQTFRDSSITGYRLLTALAQFQLTLVSANSLYDKVREGQDTFSIQEEKGYQLYVDHCSRCHTEPLFTNGDFVNNGLPIDSSLMDYGKGRITKLRSDSLLFKVPSLRNLAYTKPYMHDGRFEKLREVLNHYSDGVISSEYQPESTNSVKNNIELTSNQKTDILAFLKTLNDKEFVFNRAHRESR